MDNIAIIGNPCISVDNRIPSDDTYRVAKMSKTPKVQTLKARWEQELKKITNTVDKAKINATEKVNNGLHVLNNLGTSVTEFYKNVLSESARKLRVNKIVATKSLNTYGKHDGIVVENEKIVETKEDSSVVDDMDINNQIKFVSEEVNSKPDVVDTRMSRLERTGEVPVVDDNQNDKKSVMPTREVINTPTRFERYNNENPYDALINDNNNNFQPDMSEQKNETRGGDPDRYTKLIHGSESNDISARLKNAKNELSTANEEKEKAKAVNASLAREVEDVRRTIEKIKNERAKRAEQELSNTLNELQAAKADILDETRKYDNLQEELEKLIRQRDSLLNEASLYEGESYSRSRM